MLKRIFNCIYNLKNLRLMQWYSMFMIIWFTVGRIVFLYLTDDTARNFLYNPITLTIATITASYAIMIGWFYKILRSKSQIFKEHLGDLTIAISAPHLWFMIYRGYIFHKFHHLVDFGYLLLDASFVVYFVMVWVTCIHTNDNKNKESNAIAYSN